MVDNRQTIIVAEINNHLDPRLEMPSPVIGREKHISRISHIAPYYHSIEHAICCLYLRLCDSKGKLNDPIYELPELLWIKPYPEKNILHANNPP